MRTTMRFAVIWFTCSSSFRLSQAFLLSRSSSSLESKFASSWCPEDSSTHGNSRRRRRRSQRHRNVNLVSPYAARESPSSSSSSSLLMAVSSSSRSVDEQQQQQQTAQSAVEQAERYQAEAQRIRLEAEQMEVMLTLEKIQAVERKLSNPNFLKRYDPEKLVELEEQLQQLQWKLQQQPSSRQAGGGAGGGRNHTGTSVRSSKSSSFILRSDLEQQPSISSSPSMSSSLPASSSHSSSSSSSTSKSFPSTAYHPLNGFEREDLQLYLPIAHEIEAKYNNHNNNHTDGTISFTNIRQQIEEFQSTPQLQDHFQTKIRELLQEPLQDLETLQSLQQQYWHSTSDKEKQQLKRQIQQLETSLERHGNNYEYTDSIYVSKVQPMSSEELQQRLHAIQQLPKLLQALYMLRCGVILPDEDEEEVDSGGDSSSGSGADEQQVWEQKIELAILLEHYEHQLDVLEQVYQWAPLSDQQRLETQQALDHLPSAVRHHLATHVLKLDNYTLVEESDPTHTRIIRALEKGSGMTLLDDLDDDEDDDDEDSAWNTLKEIMREASSSSSSSSSAVANAVRSSEDSNDLDFVDRSRYLDEFYPCVTRLEDYRISQDVVDSFCARILQRASNNNQKPAYMVNTRPERVAGGYYLRGDNQFSDDDNGSRLVHHIQDALERHPDLRDQLEFFYIPDPAPLSDEKVELGYDDQTLILLTSKNEEVFYDNANPLMKLSVSALGFTSTALFALGASVLQPTAQDRINAAFEAGTSLDVSWLVGNVVTVSTSFLAIALVHELAHRIVAWTNKFRVGLPTIVPSVQTGITGTITPLASPPPNVHALFDFAMAGPMAGILASMAFLIVGLGLTAATDMNHIGDLPALPMYLLRASTLGGDMVELFLGKGTLMRDLPIDTVLPLHPYAVSGFVGILVNALALLPLGHTDGGRIALCMFGRRGAYVVSGFTHVLLCLVGLFGFDQAGMILVYNLFAVIWQRRPETPCRNEVDQLDLGRGAFGIATAVLVALALTPML